MANQNTLAYTDLNAEHLPQLFPNRFDGSERNPAPDATLSSFSREGLIMTNRRGSTSARLVQAKTGEQVFDRTQEHIRSLIGMIDELNEVGAEDELRVIRQQLTRLVFRAQPLPPRQLAPKSRSPRHRAAPNPS
jgi:hypothetical protein